MRPYGVRDVEKLLGLPRSAIRALIAAGFVSPARGPRGAWRFSFQDLILLRTARALAAAKVPQRRIVRSLKELRGHLPDTMPLTGLRIGAVADRVVVREGVYREAIRRCGNDPLLLYNLGVLLDDQDRLPDALEAYEAALSRDPAFADCHYNLALLYEELERPKDAIRHMAQYRRLVAGKPSR